MTAGPIATIVLAAGASTRLGRPKQLVPLMGVPLLRRAAGTALDAQLGPVFAVLGADADAVETVLHGLEVQCVRNARWAEGIGTSIVAGVAAVSADPRCEAVILMTCDQPGVTHDHLRALANVFREGGVQAVGSAYGGSVGIPALFARRCFERLLALPPSAGAKALLVAAAAVPCPACAADIDTPADLPRG